ncbi:MAG: proteasome accessory factor PafA2 [Nitrospira sp.]|nr:proteasome accessory factor PafA2 [Nitrospira sp.]
MLRIIGTETEYGIIARSPHLPDPVANSLRLIAQCPGLLAPDALWDYENENPFWDARGYRVEGEPERPGPHYNRQLNKILPNAGRLYVDGAHPEYSTPECSNPREALIYERAGDQIVADCLTQLNNSLGSDEFLVYRNNSDGKGNSFGYHENYLLPRRIAFDRLATVLLPFFVTRQIFCGAGKVGAENGTDPVSFQLSQRADFFECLLDLNTMVGRPIINTRDEPHARQAEYRRLHVIVGDANMAEISTFLKIGTTAIVMEMLEQEGTFPSLDLSDPVRAIKQVSRDLTFKGSLDLNNGRHTTAIEVQREYLHAAHRFYTTRECSPTTKDILIRWESVLDTLERDPRLLRRELDWVAKYDLITSYRDRRGCQWDDPRVAMMDLQYHDIRPSKSLYATLERTGKIERLTHDEEITRARSSAPTQTRAFFRGACLKKFPRQIYGMSWTSVLFDTGNQSIKRIPLLDPYRGTQQLTTELFQDIETVDQLISRLTT